MFDKTETFVMHNDDIENEYGGDFGNKDQFFVYENESSRDFSYSETAIYQIEESENEYEGLLSDKEVDVK